MESIFSFFTKQPILMRRSTVHLPVCLNKLCHEKRDEKIMLEKFLNARQSSLVFLTFFPIWSPCPQSRIRVLTQIVSNWLYWSVFTFSDKILTVTQTQSGLIGSILRVGVLVYWILYLWYILIWKWKIPCVDMMIPILFSIRKSASNIRQYQILMKLYIIYSYKKSLLRLNYP